MKILISLLLLIPLTNSPSGATIKRVAALSEHRGDYLLNKYEDNKAGVVCYVVSSTVQALSPAATYPLSISCVEASKQFRQTRKSK